MGEPRRAADADRQASGRAGQGRGLTPGPAGALDAVEVGRIVEPWGVKGWLRVQPHDAEGTALRAAKEWSLVLPAGERTLSVVALRRHGAGWVARAEGIDDRDAAEALAGARIRVPRAAFPEPAEDEYYWADLIGAAVVNRDGVVLGSVRGLLDNGVQSVLRVAESEEGAAERLIPFVAAYVDEVDLAARRITVDWGLDF